MQLAEYLDLIVEPTFADFQSNPRSGRHAFLTCVAIFHSVDRASHPCKPASLRGQWKKESLEFLIVDMLAHHFKHVQCGEEKQPIPSGAIPLTSIIFQQKQDDAKALGLDLHHLYFIIRDAICFVRGKASASIISKQNQMPHFTPKPPNSA